MYQSNAEWPKEAYTGKHGDSISIDQHRTKEEAQAACNMLDYSGFGGKGEYFPIRTWVSEVRPNARNQRPA